MTQRRLDPETASPKASKAMAALDGYVETCGLDHSLLDLVKTRASQINGCAFCVHLHTGEARARGEREERLYLLDVWWESPLYSDRERAAWPGPTPSPWCPRAVCPTPYTTRRAGTSRRRRWSSSWSRSA